MKRDPREFISDVIEANHAIQLAVAGLGLEGYCNSRLIRSFGEREFTIVGVTLSQLSRSDAALFAQIDQAPQIISFRNKLTHEYFTINDQLVWCVIKGNLPALLDQCTQLLRDLDGSTAKRWPRPPRSISSSSRPCAATSKLWCSAVSLKLALVTSDQAQSVFASARTTFALADPFGFEFCHAGHCR
jgi:uncharacterized protein with HEPN domain